MLSISACIITYNEERNIGRCLLALQGIVDEVIIVDSFSTDRTREIAEEMGAKVVTRAFTGYGEQKYFAQEQASHHWVLSVDADEVVSADLAQSLLAIKVQPQHDAYTVDILPNYCGAWIRHCGWYPQPKLRLWNRKKAGMANSSVHEGVQFFEKGASLGRLKGDLLHYSYATISDHIRKIEHYTEMGAKADAEKGKDCSLLKLIFAPKFQFFRDYFLRLGFLDGYYGYIVCKNSAFASFVKYSKTRQYIRRGTN